MEVARTCSSTKNLEIYGRRRSIWMIIIEVVKNMIFQKMSEANDIATEKSNYEQNALEHCSIKDKIQSKFFEYLTGVFLIRNCIKKVEFILKEEELNENIELLSSLVLTYFHDELVYITETERSKRIEAEKVILILEEQLKSLTMAVEESRKEKEQVEKSTSEMMRELTEQSEIIPRINYYPEHSVLLQVVPKQVESSFTRNFIIYVEEFSCLKAALKSWEVARYNTISVTSCFMEKIKLHRELEITEEQKIHSLEAAFRRERNSLEQLEEATKRSVDATKKVLQSAIWADSPIIVHQIHYALFQKVERNEEVLKILLQRIKSSKMYSLLIKSLGSRGSAVETDLDLFHSGWEDLEEELKEVLRLTEMLDMVEEAVEA